MRRFCMTKLSEIPTPNRGSAIVEVVRTPELLQRHVQQPPVQRLILQLRVVLPPSLQPEPPKRPGR